MAYYNASTSFNFGNSIACFIDNGIIYQIDSYGNKTQVGYTNEIVQDKDEVLEEYYKKLVELGAIVPPKSQEEINAELQQALKESQTLNFEMLQILKELKGDNLDVRTTDSESKADVSKCKPRRSDKNSDTSSTGEITE